MAYFDTTVCRSEDCRDNIVIYNQTHFVNKTTKKVLLWTGFFLGSWEKEVSNHMGKSRYKCVVTSDRTEITSADALLFNYVDLHVLAKVPGYRTPEQVWVMYNAEAPPNLHYTWFSWMGAFNWTMTYRTDSTIPSPYGTFVRLNPEEAKIAELQYKYIDFAINKTRMSVAIMSNCADVSQRYQHLDRLRQYINVDYFGKCGNLSCPLIPQGECYSQKYRFRIAFENANCKDYVTEKFWQSLRSNIVPIVNWKRKDQIINAPSHSYINIYDFQSMKELADYLIMLSKNATLYNEYFLWKRKYKILGGETIWYAFQHLCDELHRPRLAQTIIDPNRWIRTDSCAMSSVSTQVAIFVV